MNRIIIGIHGMGNKPPRKQLQIWWRAAIREGLKGRGSFWFFKFKLVYWASIVHPVALNPACKDKEDPVFLKGTLYRLAEEQLLPFSTKQFC